MVSFLNSPTPWCVVLRTVISINTSIDYSSLHLSKEIAWSLTVKRQDFDERAQSAKLKTDARRVWGLQRSMFQNIGFAACMQHPARVFGKLATMQTSCLVNTNLDAAPCFRHLIDVISASSAWYFSSIFFVQSFVRFNTSDDNSWRDSFYNNVGIFQSLCGKD